MHRVPLNPPRDVRDKMSGNTTAYESESQHFSPYRADGKLVSREGVGDGA